MEILQTVQAAKTFLLKNKTHFEVQQEHCYIHVNIRPNSLVGHILTYVQRVLAHHLAAQPVWFNVAPLKTQCT